MAAPSFPGAVEPERERFVESLGMRIHVIEWGDPAAAAGAAVPRLLGSRAQLRHARAAARRALPRRRHGRARARRVGVGGRVRVARAHPRRHRGRALARRAGASVGHSMGGGHVIDAARALPEAVRKVVNIDGFGPPPLTPEEEARLPERCAEFLDQRRAAATRSDWRPYAEPRSARSSGAARRIPRLSARMAALFRLPRRARERPTAGAGKPTRLLGHGFGPWRPDWIAHGFARLQAPLLAIHGSENDTWGPLPEAILGPRLADVRASRARDRRRRRSLRSHGAPARDGAGDPRLPGELMRLRHARIELELHELSRRDGPALLLLHALGGSSADWSEARGAVARRRVRARLLRPRPLAVGARRRVLPRAVGRRRRRRRWRISARRRSPVPVSAPTSRCCSPAAGREQVSGALLLPGRGLAGGGAEPNFDRPC